MQVSTSSLTLVDALFGGRSTVARPSRAVQTASVLFMTALTAAAAQISVPLPFTAVPFTFQPMVVLLAGLTLGSRLGMASQVLYLALGVAGFPVFAASPTLAPGALRLVGPTGGYLMAYPFAAFLTGYLAERGFDRRYATSFAAMLAGLLVIYVCGATWLGLSVGPTQALALGIAPFVLADLVKLLAASGVLPTLWKIVGGDRADHRRQ
jgi:biotin transport system substrate-specific component